MTEEAMQLQGKASSCAAPLLVCDQHAAAGVALFRHFVESHRNSVARGAGLLDHHVGDALRDLALLLGGAAGEHRDLNHRHEVALFSEVIVVELRSTGRARAPVPTWSFLLRQFVSGEEEAQLEARSLVS